MKRYLALVLVFLTACVPAPQAKTDAPLVLMFNGPTEHRHVPAAEAVTGNINVAQQPYRFASSSALRFRETHTSFSDYLVVSNVAREGRNLNAPLSVIVGTPVLTRDEKPNRNETQKQVFTTLELVARFIGTDDVTELGSLTSGTYSTSRWEAIDAELPPFAEDPDVQHLLRAAARDLAPTVAREINYYLGELGY